MAKSADNIEGEIIVAGRSRPASLVGKGNPIMSWAQQMRRRVMRRSDKHRGLSATLVQLRRFPVSAILFVEAGVTAKSVANRFFGVAGLKKVDQQ